jgi:peptide/nickel transport system substrate-binding protein
MRVDASGSPLAVPIYTVKGFPSYANVAQVLQQSWEKLGIQTDVAIQDYDTIFGNAGPVWKGQDAALVYGWAQGTDPYDFINWSSTQIPADENAPGENLGRYVNAEMDQLVVQGGLTVDLTARKQVYARIQSILAHDVPVTFLYWPKQLFAYASWLTSFKPSAFASPLWNVETWG